MRSIPLSARPIVQALALILVLAMPGRLVGQGVPNHLYDKFEASVEAADVILSSDIRIDSEDGSIGTEFDLGTLGISQNAFAPAFGVAWRPGRRHQLSLGYLYISRSGSSILDEEIHFGDSTFHAGGQIESKYSAPEMILTYRFAFMAKEKTQLGFQIGVGALFFNIDIDALGGVSGGGADTAVASFSASKSLVGPTAALGLYGMFRAGDDWYFGVNGGVLGANVGNISATNWVGGVDARFYFARNWGASAGWMINGIKISTSGDGEGWINLNGSIKYAFNVFRLGIVFGLP